MKKINIKIDNAKILSYSVELNEDKPEVSATIGLFANEKRISTFSLRTESFYSDSIKFDLPYDLIEPIKEIALKLEHILVKEANSSLKQLEAPKNI